jgi:hypothetical protein
MGSRKGINTRELQIITHEKAEVLFNDKSIPLSKIDDLHNLLPMDPIPFTEVESYKYVNHRRGYKPTVNMILSNGEEALPYVKHISTDDLEVRWIAGISGEIIVD